MNLRLRRPCAALLVWFAGVASAYAQPDAPPYDAGDLAGVLGGGGDGFARAVEPREFRFPDDHAAHPAYRAEWWYFTGNLEDAGQRPFGFQLTFFRFALAPERDDRGSAWSSPQVWMGHFAVSDIDAGDYHHFERFSRQGPGLAGALAPFEVWLEDWYARAAGPQAFPLELSAAADGVALQLTLEPGKPPVLQGEDGLSAKSAEPGNASYYYSITRLPAAGHIDIGARRYAVSGSAWLDREWSTSALADGQAGWDWFALQFDDGRELMFYRLRRRDGGFDPASAGVLVAADGAATRLSAAQVALEPLAWWQAADAAARYPAGFRLRVPSHDIDVEVTPRLANQEFRGRFRYWEGAVSVTGSAAGAPIAGRGYLEMTGYADTASTVR